MGLFGLGKKRQVLDWSKKYKNIKNEQEKQTNPAGKNSSSAQTPFSFFDTPSSEENENFEEDTLEKRKKLAKRLIDMTNRIEDLSNQIYHLQQRVEFLERKTKSEGI